MNNEEVETVRYVFKGKYYFSADCTIGSLVRLDSNFKCKECVLADIVNTVRIMCPLIMKRETRMLK